MNNLIEFLKKYNHWILFLVLEALSFVVLFRFSHYHGSVWFTQANNVVSTVNGVYTRAEAYLHLDQANSHLTSQNAILQLQNERLRQKLEAATKQTSPGEQLVLDSLQGYKLYAARVISSSIVKNDNYIVIDKGSADGIKPEMGVAGGGGVVGVVCATNTHCSLVLPIINVKSSVSCRIRRTGYYGSLQWKGGSVYYARLVDMPQYARTRNGDVVETSGYSTIFPPGLFVGKVRLEKKTRGSEQRGYKVNLGTDFGNLSDVCVFENLHKAEIEGLHHQISGDNSEK